MPFRFALKRFLFVTLVAAATLLPIGRAYPAANPLSYAMLAFITGRWEHVPDADSPNAARESLDVEALFERGMMSVELEGVYPVGGGFREFWIIGFDPGGEVLYLDVYSPGGYRSIMEGAMLVPGKVWAFDTPPGASQGFVEHRSITKISNDEIVIKFQYAVGGGALSEPVEKTYVRLNRESESDVESSGDGS